LAKSETLYHKRVIYVPHSLTKRAVYSLALVIIVMVVGTVGLHYIEGYSYIDSFYFVAMLATAEGPTATPVTVLGKIFAAFLAFVSVGTVIFAVGFIFGPFFGKLWRLSEKEIKKEEKVIAKEVGKYEKRR
jgi:hypothetical protein